MPLQSSPRPGARRRTLLAASALLWLPRLAAAAPAPAPRTPLASAINRAARFRALSQRMVKAYALTLLDMDTPALLAGSRRMAQEGFDELGRGSWPQDVAALLVPLREQYDMLQVALGVPPSREALVRAARQSNQLLAAADRLTEALQRLSGQPAGRLVNLAGRQRMLSQRLARNYCLVAVGAADAQVQEQRGADASDFREAMAALAQAPQNTPAIADALQAVQAQWVFYEAALGRAPDARGVRHVAQASEHILELMEGVVSQYEALAAAA